MPHEKELKLVRFAFDLVMCFFLLLFMLFHSVPCEEKKKHSQQKGRTLCSHFFTSSFFIFHGNTRTTSLSVSFFVGVRRKRKEREIEIEIEREIEKERELRRKK